MSRRNVIRLAAAVVVVLAVAAAGVAGTGGSREAQLVGVFADASPLEPGSEVRLSGVRIGTVQAIRLKDGKAHVSVDADPATLPLHRDARMTIKPVNLLGEHYIDVEAGTPSKPLLETGMVPAEQTSTTVTLQEVLDTLDDPTSTALATMLTGLGEGMKDSGAETAAAIRALAPAMRNAGQLGDVLGDQNAVLGQLLDRVRPVADSLASSDGAVLDGVMGSTDRMLGALAAERVAFDATLAELPATLTSARRTLAEVAGVADDATPTLKAARPVTDNLTEITGELHRFADAADPALASLKPVLDRGSALLDQAAPVVAQLRDAGPALRGTAGKFRPLGNVLLDQHLGDLMDFVRKWSLSTNGKDALSHYFRGVVHVTPNTLSDLAASALLPPKGKPLGGGRERPPATSVPVPGLPKLGPAEPDPGNATGLTQEQERSMLGQLLGGL